MVGLTAGDWKMHRGSSMFSERMAAAAPHFGEANCPPIGLPIGGVGLALQDGTLFGQQVSLRCQVSDVLGVGTPLTHGICNADRRDMLHAVVFHGISDQEVFGGKEEAAPGADAVRSPL
jgi:hypothetical protein